MHKLISKLELSIYVQNVMDDNEMDKNGKLFDTVHLANYNHALTFMHQISIVTYEKCPWRKCFLLIEGYFT